MTIIYRPACIEDLDGAVALVVHSINDMTERHAFGPMAHARPPRFQLFSLQDDPNGMWVAEDAGQMIGFAFSWVCDNLWFLAQLFVTPGQQGGGIGNELLERTLAHARNKNAANKALITFAFNRVSQGLYIRHGLFPRLPLYFFSAPREMLRDRPPTSQFRCVPIQNCAAHLHSLARIDVQALGISREKHHRFLIEESAARANMLYVGDNCVGYVYVSADGHIGPLAVGRLEDMDPAFRTALALAADGTSTQVSAFLPGVSEPTLRAAVEHGMRITFPMVLMSARDFGDWRLYLPSNPGFM